MLQDRMTINYCFRMNSNQVIESDEINKLTLGERFHVLSDNSPIIVRLTPLFLV